jgi:hypothetical protein
MALTPIQIGAKGPKKSDWDSVAQAIQLAGTAVGIANNVSNLAKTPAAAPTLTSADIAKYQVPAMTPQISQPPVDPYQRRLLGRY